MNKVYMLEISQPIGPFYLGKMSASDIISISYVNQRKGGRGHQRQLKDKEAKEIAMYCSDPDATFPTPIIMAVPKSEFKEVHCEIPEVVCFSYDRKKKIAELLDGQHRIAGIERVKDRDFELPVILMFDLTEEQKAYVFSTINGNQAKVDRSLIYDLLSLNRARSPYKTCHQIARAMNSDEASPLYRRIKMLEQRGHYAETISQNVFVTQLCDLISKDPQKEEISLKRGYKLLDQPQLVFSNYFIQEKDEVILRILNNYFSAAAEVFHNEWQDPKRYILSKTVGFTGLMKALEKLIPDGEKKGTLSKDYFVDVFRKVQIELKNTRQELTSEYFSSSGQGANKLSNIITNVLNME